MLKKSTKKIGFISSFLPNQCGIATFVSDLISSLDGAASNKEIGMTKESVDLDSVIHPDIVERTKFEGENFIPFMAKSGESAPHFLPIGDETLVRQTSSTHGPDGYITTDPDVITATQDRLRNKILAAEERITLFEEDLRDNTDTIIISYGVTSRGVTDAADSLAKKGKPVSTLTLKTLWPVPEKMIVEKCRPYKRVVVIEMNLGQYERELRRLLPDKIVDFYGQMNGKLITPGKIMEVVENE
jgi:2-oxoglutarate ferredoxin oxidoreductase subunit alpha